MAEPQHRTRFFDHRLPSLYSGRHTITVGHTLAGDSRVGDDLLPDLRQLFEVRQPRLRLLPEDVTACYPLPGSQGEYGQLLPHITLTRPSFPWFHLLRGTTEGSPWLALLLFRGGELPEDPLAVGQVKVCTAAELVAGQAGPGRPPVLDPPLYDDEREVTVTSVLVPGPLFTAICPTTYELGMLAHIREGGPPDATRVVGTDPPPDENDVKAVLVSGRFPSTGGMQVAHLVSLEGFEDYLDGKTPPPAAGLRLMSLHSWAFTSIDDGQRGFGEIARELAADPAPLLRHHPLPASSDVPRALDLLRHGGTALPQGLESGETTVGFYRGPFTALPAHELPQGRGFRLNSAGEGLVYVEELGVYDTGYAVAFSLGRTLALADSQFRTALMAFRKEARHTVRRLLAFPELGSTDDGVAAANDTRVARRAFDRLLGEDGPLVRALARPGGDIRAAGRRSAARTPEPTPLTSDRLRTAVADASTRAVLTAAVQAQLQPVRAWLTRLARLETVPFGHLVPDERLLPPESVRFFHVDTGWIDAAVDGALSVGVGHALDADLNGLARELRDIPQFASGVVVRSELVSGWPEMVTTAFSGNRESRPLRQHALGEDLLILLYGDVVDRFALAEPPQGLHFGLSFDNTTELRSIVRPVGEGLGDFPSDGGGYGQFLRPGGHDVLDIERRLAPALAAAHSVPELSSAQFALQLVKAPLLQQFRSRPSSAQVTEEAL
ncbi:hypothetical protein [Actinokineospora sp. NBRC 105648]|uniref:hypothetical protein n=1 Tax=Actinokineospora sp. NBRC 105648 TaxID=3032206 RepID=UPI0024A2391D|nr:hypothetical protein [Actinokineospora sp. NBRC 105648]GLZ37938.1 hypothetical protein Acsp05_15620 [Actinokineospora sp. NBRC 105648]